MPPLSLSHLLILKEPADFILMENLVSAIVVSVCFFKRLIDEASYLSEILGNVFAFLIFKAEI